MQDFLDYLEDLEQKGKVSKAEEIDELINNYCNFLFRVYLNSFIAEEICFGDLNPGDKPPVEYCKKKMGWGKGDAPVSGITINKSGLIHDKPIVFFQQLFLNGQLGLILNHVENSTEGIKEGNGANCNMPQQAITKSEDIKEQKEMNEKKSTWEEEQNANPIVQYAKTFLPLFQNILKQKTSKEHLETRYPYTEKQREQIREFHCAVIEKKIVAGDMVNSYFKRFRELPIYTKRLLREEGKKLYLREDDINSTEFKLSIMQNFNLNRVNHAYILMDKIMKWEVSQLCDAEKKHY